MGRLYVPSTPATRGEKGAKDAAEVEAAAAAEAAADFEDPTPWVPDALQPDTVEPAEPAGNASTEEWEAYARTRGAADEDLVDGDGKALGRDALRDKFSKTSDTQWGKRPPK